MTVITEVDLEVFNHRLMTQDIPFMMKKSRGISSIKNGMNRSIINAANDCIQYQVSIL